MNISQSSYRLTLQSTFPSERRGIIQSRALLYSQSKPPSPLESVNTIHSPARTRIIFSLTASATRGPLDLFGRSFFCLLESCTTKNTTHTRAFSFASSLCGSLSANQIKLRRRCVCGHSPLEIPPIFCRALLSFFCGDATTRLVRDFFVF